jgi:hypothetical protein
MIAPTGEGLADPEDDRDTAGDVVAVINPFPEQKRGRKWFRGEGLRKAGDEDGPTPPVRKPIELCAQGAGG